MQLYSLLVFGCHKAQKLQNFFKLGAGIFKKVFIGRAEIVFAVMSLPERFAVSAAAVAAQHKPLALSAFFRQRF